MNCITLPSSLEDFHNYKTEIVTTASNRELYLLHGQLKGAEKDSLCPHCGRKMHIHNNYEVNLRHLGFGHRQSCMDLSFNLE